MKTKSIITTLLLIIVIGSIGFLLYQELASNSAEKSQSDSTDAEQLIRQNQNKIIAYYFHRTKRCPTCIKIEEYTDEAIKTGFADELKRKQLEWRIINIEDKGNEHFEEDYKLYAQSVVLVEMKNGKQERWKNLERIWDIVGNKEGFLSYVQEEIKLFMESKS